MIAQFTEVKKNLLRDVSAIDWPCWIARDDTSCVQYTSVPADIPEPAWETLGELWPTTVKMYGLGRLFFWREVATSLLPGHHVLELWPVLDGSNSEGQLRIESIYKAGD